VEFVFLTYLEADGAPIRWDEQQAKPPDLVSAALEAGFNQDEVQDSPLGVLERDFELAGCIFRTGARALVGNNGSTLLEI
jgi:hypothetical protein